MNEEKISRICWNDYFWEKPSGRAGKSMDKDSYEYQRGYGHEEWLLDTSKIIDGYHYGYLQPVGNGWKKHMGNRYDISLYSIHAKTREKWWIGKINNVIVIPYEESETIKKEYVRRKWFAEMTDQLNDVGIDLKNSTIDFNCCIKYRPADLALLPEPLRISKDDRAISAFYYVLLNKNEEPLFELSVNGRFVFRPGHTDRNEKSAGRYSKDSYEIEFFHNEMTNNAYRQLVKEHGECKVSSESDTGYGTLIDLCVDDTDGRVFYEFKTGNSLKLCIREAVGQLMEYCYYPDTSLAKKLVIVSQNRVNPESRTYLEHLRKTLHLPIYYRRYDPEKKLLEDTMY